MPEQQQRVEIGFPLRGLEENWAFDQQPPRTTRDLLNVRAIDPDTGRTRGAQRSGMTRFLNDTISSGSLKVKDIVGVTAAQARISYTTAVAGELVWSVDSPNDQDLVDIKIDDFGNLYVLQLTLGGVKYNQDGAELARFPIPSATGVKGSAIVVDEFQNVLISTFTTGTSTECRVHAFVLQQDGTYKKTWALDTGAGQGATDMILTTTADNKTSLYVCTFEPAISGQGYFKVFPDIDLVLASVTAPTEDTTKRVPLIWSSGSGDDLPAETARPARMALADTGYVVIVGTPGVNANRDTTELWVVNPEANDPTAIVSQQTDVSGVGMGVVMGLTIETGGGQSVYTMGPSLSTLEDEPIVRRWSLSSAGVMSSTATGTWEYINGSAGGFDEAANIGNMYRMAVDGDGNVYVPATVSNGVQTVFIFGGEPGSGGGPGDPLELNHVLSTGDSAGVNAVAVHPSRPAGFDVDGSAISGTGIEEFEFIYIVGIGASDATSKIAMATVSQSTGTLRSQTLLAVGGADVEKFTAGGAFTDPAGTDGTGVGALDTNAPYVQSTVSIARFDAKDDKKGRLRAYVTDGKNYKKYDPEDDKVTAWGSATQGIIPPRCRLIELWAGRIVLAADPENPAAWHMSAINNPEDWDNFPQNINAAQAVSGINAPAGDSPDIVNSLMPWDDDLLLIAGDRTITRLDGDPMGGGQINLVTDQTGVAFGRPWCKEPGGTTMYFMSTQCAVFAMGRGGGMQRLTRDRIERRMQDAINWSTHYVRLVWNYRDEGFHVFQLPYGSGGTIVKHWFWDRKNDAWFEDQIGNSTDTTKQPTAVYVLDGDAPTDRVLLIGCEDGRIRVWDEDAPNDDYASATDRGVAGGGDLAIDSYVTIGPIQPRSHSLETMFTELRVWLARDQDGVNYDVFVDDEPDFSLDLAAVAGGSLLPGHNPTELVRFTGDSCYLRLRNALSTQRWAFERATISYVPAGMKRA